MPEFHRCTGSAAWSTSRAVFSLPAVLFGAALFGSMPPAARADTVDTGDPALAAIPTDTPAIAADQDIAQRWDTLARHYFGDRRIVAGDDLLAIDAPKRAHDAAVVPIAVNALDPARPVVRLHLIVDMNPLPLAGIVTFSDQARDWQSFATRIRINEYTTVRAIGELADGSLHMVSRFVKAAGGCSAPAMADLDAAIANAGRMQLLLGEADDDPPSSPLTEAVVKISHPNNSGMQFDQVSRNYIPAFYVKSITADVDGEPLFEVETNFSMSENPVLSLRYHAPGDGAPVGIDAHAIDSKGNRFEKTAES